MRPALVLCTALLHGCCCCGFGGGNDDGRNGEASALERWAGEKLAEVAVETIGGGDLDIDEAGKKVTVTVEEGSMTILADGSLPPDFPFTMPEGTEIEASSTLTTKEGIVTDSVQAETTAQPAVVQAHFRAQAEAKGYALKDPIQEGMAALEKARAEGMEIPEGAMDLSASEGLLLFGEDAQGGQVTLMVSPEDAGAAFSINVLRKPAKPVVAPAEAVTP